jgi:4-hydroxybenzoate polyprenyltransferase
MTLYLKEKSKTLNALCKGFLLKLKNLITLNSLILSSIEKKTPIDSIFKTLTFIIIARTFFELLLEKRHSFKYYPDFYANIVSYIHIYLFWLCLFFTVAILITIFLKLQFVKSMKLALIFFPIILIPPFADFVLTRGEGSFLMYSFEIATFPYSYLNCFNPFAKIETVTAGVRLEIAIAFLGSFYISFCVFKKGILRSLFLAVCIYTVILLYGYLPALYKVSGMDFYALSGKSISEITLPQKFLFMYLLPVILISWVTIYLLFKENRENLKSIFSFFYPSRLLFYILLLAFGFIFAANQSHAYPAILNIEDILKLLLAVISIKLLFCYSKIINDIYDIEIDMISNKERPFVKNTISVEYAHQIKNIMLIISFIFAIAAEISFIFYWLFMLSASYVYSVPPLRLRRYYPVGHLILSSIGISTFLAGGALINSYEVYIQLQQKEVLLYIFSAFFFISHVKDFKDIEGDKAAGVQNIMNLISAPKTMGIIFISGFTLSTYLIARILNIANAAMIIGMLLFLSGSVYYILKTKSISRLDRLLMLALIFLIYLTCLWIYQITP